MANSAEKSPPPPHRRYPHHLVSPRLKMSQERKLLYREQIVRLVSTSKTLPLALGKSTGQQPRTKKAKVSPRESVGRWFLSKG